MGRRKYKLLRDVCCKIAKKDYLLVFFKGIIYKLLELLESLFKSQTLQLQYAYIKNKVILLQDQLGQQNASKIGLVVYVKILIVSRL